MRRAAVVLLAACVLGAASPKVWTAKDLATLVESAERTTVVHLWATWCAACTEELPTLGPALERTTKDARVVVLGLDEPSDASRARTFLTKHGVRTAETATLVADPDDVQRLLDPTWPAGDLPATFVFRGKKLVRAFHGETDVKKLAEAVTAR